MLKTLNNFIFLISKTLNNFINQYFSFDKHKYI